MCGIVGSYTSVGDNPISDEIVIAMRDRMLHRGPDGGGLWRSPDRRCVLGHRRLAIIDLSDVAAQPMINDDATVAITFNGEIYNHRELRDELSSQTAIRWKTDHSDTEVLLRAYEQWGIECVHKLIGMFAFVIYDGRERDNPHLYLVRDRIGIKPLYIHRSSNGEWLFASEIRAMLEHPDVSAEIEPAALWHYLTFIVAPAPLTMFKGIFKLPPASVVSINGRGEGSSWTYWTCVPSAANTFKESELSYAEATAQLTQKLRTAIERRMVSDVPFGVLLSGGVDSSLNVGLMSEIMERPVTTFTVGYDAYDEFNEFEHARQIAKRYGTEHHETRIDSHEAMEFLPMLVELQDEPIADNVCIPLYFLARLVKERGTTVVQVGEGADENFLGYWWCEHYRKKALDVYEPARNGMRPKLLRNLPLFSRRARFAGGEDDEIRWRAEHGQELFWGGAVCWWGDLRNRLTPHPSRFASQVECPVAGMLPGDFEKQDSHAVVASYYEKMNGALAKPEILQKIPYMELALRLPEHLLMRVDKMTMAHSVEARVPFLDHEVVEFAMRLPPNYKLRDGVGKRILKSVAEPYLDQDLLYRRKQGFGAPVDKWFREKEFGDRCIAALKRSKLLSEGYFDADYLLDLMDKQVAGRAGYGFHLWTVMNAVLWHERWVEGTLDSF